MSKMCYFCVCRFFDLFFFSARFVFVIFVGLPFPSPFWTFDIFFFLLLVDLLFSLDLLLSLYLWGLFPLSVLNICYFCLLLPWFFIFVRFAIFVIFVIFVGTPCRLCFQHLLFLFLLLVDLLFLQCRFVIFVVFVRPLPFTVLNICYYCSSCLLTCYFPARLVVLVIFVIFVGPSSFFCRRKLLFLLVSLDSSVTLTRFFISVST